MDFTYRSLDTGRILDGDTLLFERGLTYVAHLPTTRIPRATVDEMLNSGVLSRIANEPLKQAITNGYVVHENMVEQFSWWRDMPVDLIGVMAGRVEYYSGEDGPDPIVQTHRVRFEFNALRQDPQIRNSFYWARDTHEDWLLQIESVKEATSQARGMIQDDLQAREGQE